MEPFKNFINEQTVRDTAHHLHRAWPGFPRKAFESRATAGLAELELKARVMHLSLALEACLPVDFAHAADIIEAYGDDRIMVNSAGDWGPSNPIAVPDFIQELRKRGHPESKIKKIVYDNPLEFFRQCKRFEFTPPDTLADAVPTEESAVK